MKIFDAAVISAALLSTMTAALADDAKIEMSKLTCAQFTGYNNDNMGLIMMWLEGYYTEEDDDAVIDFGKMAGHDAAPDLLRRHPDTDIITAADEAMGE